MSTASTFKTPNALHYAACIGLDWGDQNHALALQPAQGPTESSTLLNSPEVLHRWLQQLEQRFHGQPVALAVETSRGPLIHIFSAYPWLTVYPIHPATSARFRSAFTPSGAKDDQPDAQLLLELVLWHSDKLRPLQLQDAATRKLAALVEVRRDSVDRRTQVLNQLTSLLKAYFPQALELVGHNLSTTLALEFLRRWPELLALKAARPATLKSFYHRHSVRSAELVARRLALVQEAKALTTDEAVLQPAQLQLQLLLEQVRVFQKHIGSLEKQIAALFASHAEAYLFRDLPGAGAALKPRLLVAFGQDRTLYPDPSSFQKASGIAPVVEKSGRQRWTHWRWQASVFLRQSLIEWAGQTVVYSRWAGLYYQRMKAKGKTHHVILRALAFKWIRILWKCWQSRTPYDEQRYLQQLTHRKSPLAEALKS